MGIRTGPAFNNRDNAGAELAEKLLPYRGREDVAVLALPRGGVPVAYRIAAILKAPLDIVIVRKIGAPQQPELAIAAAASGGVLVVNDEVMPQVRLSGVEFRRAVRRARAEIERREARYRGDLPELDIRDRRIILVDDGMATGASMQAAVNSLVRRGVESVVVAVPTAARQAVEKLRPEVDEVVCLEIPENFYSVGDRYRHFEQLTDEEVGQLLRKARRLNCE